MDKFLEFIREIPPEIHGAVMAIIISILRVLYDGKEKRPLRITLEALICGGLSLCASSVLGWVGLPASMSIAAGGAIGFVGVEQLRARLIKYLRSKTE